MTVVIPFNHLGCISGNTSDRESFTIPKKEVTLLSSQASLYITAQASKNLYLVKEKYFWHSHCNHCNKHISMTTDRWEMHVMKKLILKPKPLMCLQQVPPNALRYPFSYQTVTVTTDFRKKKHCFWFSRLNDSFWNDSS